MVVLMTADTVGGVWTFALELAEALAGRGDRVVLAALGGAPRQRADIPGVEVLPSEFKLEWMEEPWEDVERSGQWLLGLEEEYAPDVVHLNSFGHGALPFHAPVVMTAHSCVLSWWSAVKGEAAPEEWRRYHYEVEMALQRVDLVTAPSQAMLDALYVHYAMGAQRCRVVPNGRCASRYTPAKKEPFILTAGRLWDEAKNVSALVQAASRLDWPVYVAGEQQHPGGRRAEFGACRPLGRLGQAELAGWYGRASIYALPARYEPFGLSALEAALAGCVLVLGDIPSLREVWGDAAIYVPPDDTGALESAIGGLIADADRRCVMSARSSARAREYTVERMAEGYLKAYEAAGAGGRVACAS
jgi:glycogen(starch) synthase